MRSSKSITSSLSAPLGIAETTAQHPDAGLAKGIFAAALIIYASFCGVFLAHPSRWFLGYTADDAFYYLQVARHIAATGFSTFDGINPTNGYHPGWMLLMVLCAKLFPNRDVLLKASFAMEFVCQIGTCLVLVLIMRRLMSEFWAWIIGSAWLLNPLPFVFSINGVEATLVQLTLALAVLAYMTQIAPYLGAGKDASPPTRNLVLFGGSLALAFYSRTDQAILALVSVLCLLTATVLLAGAGQRLSASWRVVLWVGGTFLVCIVPWYAYSHLVTGSFAQDSGAMKMLWHHQEHLPPGVLTRVRFVLGFLVYEWFSDHLDMYGATIHLRKILLAATVLFIIWAWGATRRSHSGKLWMGVSVGLMLFGVISGIIYALFLSGLQFWHFSASAFISFLLVAGWGALALQRVLPPQAQKIAGLGIVAAMLGFGSWYHLTAKAEPLWQIAVYDSQPRFEQMVPPGARIGCFNAGIPAYFSSRTIVNLDGLVNHAVYPYWKNHQFAQYLIDQHIDYIADEEEALGRAQRFSTAPIHLHPITRVPLPGWHTPYRYLWKVENISQGSRQK